MIQILYNFKYCSLLYRLAGQSPAPQCNPMNTSLEGHLTSAVKNKLESKFISYVVVPANMTDLFQPLDVSVHKAAKNELRKC